MNHTRISKAVILLLFVVLAFIFIKYSISGDTRESVIYSTTQCIQSICVENTAAGDLCSVRTPRISEVLIIADGQNHNIKNVRVIPSDDRCQ